MPYLSVIIPAYNSEATLERCVRSVLDQTFVDLELIIVDDGSTDSTEQRRQRCAEPGSQPGAGKLCGLSGRGRLDRSSDL